MITFFSSMPAKTHLTDEAEIFHFFQPTVKRLGKSISVIGSARKLLTMFRRVEDLVLGDVSQAKEPPPNTVGSCRGLMYLREHLLSAEFEE